MFAIGMLAAEISTVPAAIRVSSGVAASIGAPLALLVGAALFSNPNGWALPLFAVFFISVACGNNCFGLLTTRAAALLGEVSFSVYLVHGCVLSLFFVEGAALMHGWSNMQIVAVLPLLTIVTMMIAYVTYRYVERPSVDLGRAAIAQLLTWEQGVGRVLSGAVGARPAAANALD
ncbi:MAG: hypothetical protein EOP89_05180 [Lysobacteraceae bacterium]|nr:MAG: hypothetical protein EOP89_05180 [Xanthomonadaceae bacterium]